MGTYRTRTRAPRWAHPHVHPHVAPRVHPNPYPHVHVQPLVHLDGCTRMCLCTRMRMHMCMCTWAAGRYGQWAMAPERNRARPPRSFIHASPMLVAYTSRWHTAAVEEAWPGLLGGTAALEMPVSLLWDLALPGMAYYFTWWVPYTAWLLLDGITRPERGYDTVFANFEPLVKAQLGVTSTARAAVTYNLIHAFATNLAWLVVAGCYASYYVHTVFLLGVLVLAIKAGAAMYEYLILDSYEATLQTALRDRHVGDTTLV